MESLFCYLEGCSLDQYICPVTPFHIPMVITSQSSKILTQYKVKLQLGVYDIYLFYVFTKYNVCYELMLITCFSFHNVN